MKQIYFFIYFIFLFSNVSFSQITISGFVYNEDDEPLIGVNIAERENPTNGTISDVNGDFSLTVESEYSRLIISYIGFKSQEIKVAEEKEFNIILKEDALLLDEIVVTGLDLKSRKRDLGYSTEDFDGEELALSDAPNLVSSLHGKSAGVQISSPNGVDGGTTRIVIRGNNNISSNNQPLIVLDGVPIENSPGLENIGRGVDWGSAINNINPSDIETVNILKGPTAAAKYGSRGANGVILISTKRGKKREGIGIDYSIQHKVIQPYRYRDVQNIYGAGGPVSLLEPTFLKDAEGNLLYPDDTHTVNGPFGKPTTELFGFYGTAVSWGPEMLGQMIKWWDGEMRPFDPQPDNLGFYFDNGNTTTHNLSFSGGGEQGTVRLSLTRQDHNAVVPNSNFNQTTVNLGSRLAISSKVTADLSVNYINYQRLNSPTLGDDHQNSFGKGVLYSFPRSYKGLERDINILPDGTRNNYDGKYPFLYSGPHIWWNTFNNNTTLDRNKLIGALALTYEISDWLSFRGRLGTDFTFNQFESRNNPIDIIGVDGGKYGTELARDRVLNNDFLITAQKGKIFNSLANVSFSIGANQWSRSRYGIRAESDRWVNPWLFNLNNYESLRTQQLPREIRYEKKINSVFSFLNLSYDDYLFLEITGRNDWSSSLPIDNNSYFYPSASLSFILTDALDLKTKWLDFLKIKGAYAQTATDTDPFQVDFTYVTGAFGGNQTAVLPSVIPPIDLKPQQANSYEAGLTIGAFDNKLSIDLTYYYIRSFDQILDAALPASSGATGIRINTGELENKGIEAIISANIIEKKHFFLQTGLNIARNRNHILSMGLGAKSLELANIWGENGPAISVREGDEFGTIIGYDYIYHEGNGEPILNEDGTHYLITENRVPIGNASPDFTGGWNMKIGYKGFRLTTLIDFKWGGDIYAGSYVIGLQTGQSPETLVERQGGGLPYTDPDGNLRNVGVILDGVHEDGSQNQNVVHYLFKYIPNTGGWGRFLSTPGILDNSWIKFRELTFSYDFPQKITRKTKVFQNLSIAFVGRDLFYFYSSLPDRINPEGNNGSGNAQGLEWAAFPGMRSFGFKINGSF